MKGPLRHVWPFSVPGSLLTFVSMGPGAMALNLIPYLPHSATKDLCVVYGTHIDYCMRAYD